ncbi:MAG TPA: GatB/YqeY domain-containing protein [Aminobacteriaceae bacterium]|nr:GatB/YqeY domain-containing protein [Aminobacteriaceae bacterium]
MEHIVEEAGAFVKAAGPKDTGKVMGKVMAAVKGRADGKRVRSKVHDYLQTLVE